MSTKYDYVQETHLILLTEEIETSAIVTALDFIDYSGTTTSIWFKAALSTTDEAILDGILAAHDKDSYVAPLEPIAATLVRQEAVDENVPYVYSSPRPMNHYSYFTSEGDAATGYGGGGKLLFDLLSTDASKTVDITFNEDVYLKDGWVYCQDAPFGATLDVEVHHPIAGYMLSFCKKVPLCGTLTTEMVTNDRASLPAGLIMKLTIHNSTGTNGEDPAADFKAFGRLEMYRPKPPGSY